MACTQIARLLSARHYIIKINVARFARIFHFLLQVTVEEEYFLYTLDGFVADIGGYLGLFLGASLLSSLTQLLHILTCARKVQPTES